MKEEKLNFAVIGAGRFAKNYIRMLNDIPQCNLSAIVAKTTEKFSEIKGLAGEETLLTTDIGQVLKNKKISCVIIATPPSTHFEIAKNCILAKKNILLEKPMTLKFSDAKKLKALMEDYSGNFMVGHQYCYNDYFGYLKKEISKGNFGKIDFVFGQHYYPGPWSEAGVLIDAGTHKLSMINYLFENLKIRKINGLSRDILGNGKDDYSSVELDFGKLKFSFMLSWMHPEKERKLFVFGSKKTAVYDEYSENKLKIYDVLAPAKQHRSIYADSINSLENIKFFAPKINASQPLLNQLNHFISCVKTGNVSVTGFDSSYKISEWLDLISRKIEVSGY